MRLIITLLLSLNACFVFAQSDTTFVFLNENGKKVKEEKAKFIVKTYSSVEGWVKDVYTLNGVLEIREAFADERCLIINGKTQVFKSGQIFTDGNYYKGQRSGTWSTYNSDGKVIAIKNYMLNYLNGDYNVFWPSGKPKVVGVYAQNKRFGEWVFTYENGAVAAKVVYDGKGVAKESFYHDLNGKPTNPESIERRPEFPSGPNAFYRFIGQNLKYPLEDAKMGTSGEVVCGFTINEDGIVGNVFVASSPSNSFAYEAIRVLKLSPKWQAGTLFGEPIEVEYTVPIKFGITTIR